MSWGRIGAGLVGGAAALLVGCGGAEGMVGDEYGAQGEALEAIDSQAQTALAAQTQADAAAAGAAASPQATIVVDPTTKSVFVQVGSSTDPIPARIANEAARPVTGTVDSPQGGCDRRSTSSTQSGQSSSGDHR